MMRVTKTLNIICTIADYSKRQSSLVVCQIDNCGDIRCETIVQKPTKDELAGGSSAKRELFHATFAWLNSALYAINSTLPTRRKPYYEKITRFTRISANHWAEEEMQSKLCIPRIEQILLTHRDRIYACGQSYSSEHAKIPPESRHESDIEQFDAKIGEWQPLIFHNYKKIALNFDALCANNLVSGVLGKKIFCFKNGTQDLTVFDIENRSYEKIKLSLASNFKYMLKQLVTIGGKLFGIQRILVDVPLPVGVPIQFARKIYENMIVQFDAQSNSWHDLYLLQCKYGFLDEARAIIGILEWNQKFCIILESVITHNIAIEVANFATGIYEPPINLPTTITNALFAFTA
ncbi:MAG: hypothetical protein M0R33_18960 [Methylomonas sp.]|jgi:hypothetical protein|uniref:hypothetical protein n=1 Tax=Methylomonas sp. TaxID=418 RepID=UPI0025EFDD2A|nr:hypothetical protein [Methylomonas sp.]MCK9608526.1 hypothetical protein [Methylomonas sp.]